MTNGRGILDVNLVVKIMIQVRAVVLFKRPKNILQKKDDFLTFELCSNPMNEAFPTYNLTIPFFKTDTAEE